MRLRVAIFTIWTVVLCRAGAVPAPREHFGFSPGDDYKLADYEQITSYFRKLEAASGRIRLAEFGKTSGGTPMYAAFISSPENLKRLEHWREINRKLALGLASAEEAPALAREGKAIVWIDSGLHATEVAPAQHSPELAYRLVTGDSAGIRGILDNVVLIQIPVINPDGLDMVAQWYRKNAGTPYEAAPLPWLYQKYSGHDNNRDWFMLNLPETRNVERLLFQEWFPQIVYNQHQAPPFPARIFVPPYSDPLNPNIPAAIMEGIHGIGAAIKERFALENKPGALSYLGFDAWWDGGLRSAPAFHNMHGILTETAGFSYATPHTYEPSDLPERFANGMPTRQPSVFYQRPWLGGRWGLRDAIEYMLTADMAILDLASTRKEAFLMKAWDLARAAIEAGRAGKPYAYVIPERQSDPDAAAEMLRRLQMAGIQVQRAKSSFTASGKSYPAGSHVLLAAQPFRAYLMDLLEPQKYPELRTGASGPVKKPYDVAGWTLSMLMGVAVDRVDAPFDADLAPQPEIREARLAWAGTAASRIALYEPWTANIDTGWTQWVLDRFGVPHTLIHNSDFQADNLRSRFDTIVIASQNAASILHGVRPAEMPAAEADRKRLPKVVQRPEYTGGIGTRGLANLEEFVTSGGTLVALDDATELPLQSFGIPVRDVGRGFECPGSIVRITLDAPPETVFAFSTGGHAFELSQYPEFNTGDRAVRSIAKFADKDLLASGWLAGEKTIAGKDAVVEARHGKGRVILFAIRPQFRGQTFGTFRLLLNALSTPEKAAPSLPAR